MAATQTRIEAARELDELYRGHAAEVYRFVYAVLGNRSDAEDITQTTFVNALRALERGERPRKPANWLMTIAHNLIRQRFRQQQSRPREVQLEGDLVTPESDGDGPSIEDLVRALQRIPETQREALVLRELEGRSSKEIASILSVSQTALQALLFRARRSLTEELENLVTCDRAELALSQQMDGRLGRKERKRLVAHLEECPNCSRIATLSVKRRRAFKGLALLPLPFSLTLFKGAPTASAAAGLPTIGGGAVAGTAAGVGAAGVGAGLTAKIAIGVAAVAVAGGAGYEGVQVVTGPPTPPARTAHAANVAIIPAAAQGAIVRAQSAAAKKGPVVAKTKPVAAKAKKPIAKKPHPITPTRASMPVKSRRATAPGQTKPATERNVKRPAVPGETRAARAKSKIPTARGRAKAEPEAKVKAKPEAKEKPEPVVAKGEPVVAKAEPLRGKSATAPGQAIDPLAEAKAKSPR